jgi:hypothetical protein
MASEPTAEQFWRMLLSGETSWEEDRRRFGLLPAHDRCKNCNAPFDSIGAFVARLLGRGRYQKNPRFCDF